MARDSKRRYLLNATLNRRPELRSVEPQLFNIGVLLVEIVLCRPVLRVKRLRVQDLIELDLVFAENLERDNDGDDLSTGDEDSDSESEFEPDYVVAAEAIL